VPLPDRFRPPPRAIESPRSPDQLLDLPPGRRPRVEVHDVHSSGSKTAHQADLHFIRKELFAARQTVETSPPFLRNSSVLVQSDNTTVVAYLRRQEGTKSVTPLRDTIAFFELTACHCALSWIIPPPALLPRILLHLNSATGTCVLVTPRWERVFRRPDLKPLPFGPPLPTDSRPPRLLDLSTGLSPETVFSLLLEA